MLSAPSPLSLGAPSPAERGHPPRSGLALRGNAGSGLGGYAGKCFGMKPSTFWKLSAFRAPILPRQEKIQRPHHPTPESLRGCGVGDPGAGPPFWRFLQEQSNFCTVPAPQHVKQALCRHGTTTAPSAMPPRAVPKAIQQPGRVPVAQTKKKKTTRPPNGFGRQKARNQPARSDGEACSDCGSRCHGRRQRRAQPFRPLASSRYLILGFLSAVIPPRAIKAVLNGTSERLAGLWQARVLQQLLAACSPPSATAFCRGRRSLCWPKPKSWVRKETWSLFPAPRTEYKWLREAEFEPRALSCASPKPREHRDAAGLVCDLQPPAATTRAPAWLQCQAPRIQLRFSGQALFPKKKKRHKDNKSSGRILSHAFNCTGQGDELIMTQIHV